MPILTTQLLNLGQQADSTFRVREEHTDTLGVVWKFQYRAASLAEATAIMDARDLTPSLRSRDFRDLREHVAQGSPNGTDTFEYTTPLRDITEEDGEEEILTFFAAASGEDAMAFAWWWEDLNGPDQTTINERVEFSAQDLSDIGDRAIDLLAAEARFNLTFDDPR